MDHTFLIIARQGSSFSVTPVEIDPHTTQGQQALATALNSVSVGGQVITQVMDCGKKS